MINKRSLLIFLISIVFLTLLANWASAGCCLYGTLGSSCETKDSASNCTTTPMNFSSSDCASLNECQIGCCCDQGQSLGTKSTNYSCNSFTPPKTFKLDPAASSSCSCGSGSYSISGKVTKTTGTPLTPLSGATVSVGTVTTTTGSIGTYILSNVPNGTNVIVRASKNDECTPNSIALPTFIGDVSDVNIALNCQCVPETCNATSHTYCKSTSVWQTYNLTNETQKATYCSFPQCLAADSECNVSNICQAGDGVCPSICSSNPSYNNYDSDCVCSTTSNGVCPSGCDSNIGGANYDIDCNAYSPTCGDNLITYPYETCEQTPAPGQLSLCSADQCIGAGETGECNCAGLSGCGNLVLESGEECEIGMVCSNGAACENCKCGTPTCTGNNSNPSVALSFDAVDKKIIASWTLLSACLPSVIDYSIFKCSKDISGGTSCSSKTDFSPLITAISHDATNISDSDINQTSEYCYYVRVDYRDRSPGESMIKCINTGNYYCMENPPAEFCMVNSRSRCDANYNIVEVQKCGLNQHCMGPDRNGKTECLNQSVCDQCNGLYGMFSYLDLGIIYEDGSNKYCHPGSGPRVEGCYLDNTKTLFSAFNYCSSIVTCYDYKSQQTCTDSSDPCGKNRGCQWAWLDNSTHELGGICRPSNPTLQKCELCDDEKYNWLSPGCTPRVCSLFGTCYFQGVSSSKPNVKSCTKQVTAKCADYLTQQTCTGGTPVTVDAVYNTAGNRMGGTHFLTPSKDVLGLGKCYWVASANRTNGGACYRNADNLSINFIKNTGYDCSNKDYYCEADFTSPVTTIMPSAFGVYPANTNIKFAVSDNYPSDQIQTYFCVSPSLSTCYPNESVTGSIGVYSKRITTSGTYNLFYYSEDSAKNLEVVQHTQIRVDAEKPFVYLTNPANASTFPTNQLEVTVEGVTSTDSKFICAKNTKSGITRCINNCALTGNTAPCFSDQTGVFTLTISLGNNTNLTGVLFTAEDYAGNTYSNTLLGVLLKLVPPDAPLITVLPIK